MRASSGTQRNGIARRQEKTDILFPRLQSPSLMGLRHSRAFRDLPMGARRNGGALVAASALMALEAWAHSSSNLGSAICRSTARCAGTVGIEASRSSASPPISCSRIGRAARRSGVANARGARVVELRPHAIQQDIAGLGRFSVPEREKASWRVKAADLAARPSRRLRLIDVIGDWGLPARAIFGAELRSALDVARSGSPG